MAFHVRKQQGCIEMCLDMGEKPDEIFWDRIGSQINIGNIMMGVCYRLCDQQEVYESNFGQL